MFALFKKRQNVFIKLIHDQAAATLAGIEALQAYLAVLDGVTLADVNAPAATVVQLPPSRRGARMPGLPLAPDQV